VTSGAITRTIGRLFLVTGLAAMSWSGYVWTRADFERTARANELPVVAEVSIPGRGHTLGLLEVPRLELTAIVVEGDDAPSLQVAAGHLPDTPLPWNEGNSALAAHRDADFRALKGIREGDVIRFHTADTVMEYVVRETLIVEPTDVSVLRATERPTLTLITCYPFTYIGPAPKRFIVRAERTSNGRAIL
jgi:sortase A